MVYAMTMRAAIGTRKHVGDWRRAMSGGEKGCTRWNECELKLNSCAGLCRVRGRRSKKRGGGSGGRGGHLAVASGWHVVQTSALVDQARGIARSNGWRCRWRQHPCLQCPIKQWRAGTPTACRKLKMRHSRVCSVPVGERAMARCVDVAGVCRCGS
jgi:hypothetical protein